MYISIYILFCCCSFYIYIQDIHNGHITVASKKEVARAMNHNWHVIALKKEHQDKIAIVQKEHKQELATKQLLYKQNPADFLREQKNHVASLHKKYNAECNAFVPCAHKNVISKG